MLIVCHRSRVLWIPRSKTWHEKKCYNKTGMSREGYITSKWASVLQRGRRKGFITRHTVLVQLVIRVAFVVGFCFLTAVLLCCSSPLRQPIKLHYAAESRIVGYQDSRGIILAAPSSKRTHAHAYMHAHSGAINGTRFEWGLVTSGSQSRRYLKDTRLN